MSSLPTLKDAMRARETLGDRVKTTPVLTSASLSAITGATLVLKAENMQRTGSFKVRGALNRLASLSESERTKGVMAASAGNHGQAVAWAAQQLGVPCAVVMPVAASVAKIAATRGYGASIILEGESFDGAVEAARRRCAESGEIFIPAYDDPMVIAGQGTLGIELLDQLPNINNLLVPIGGGGLAAGIAIAISELRPSVRIIGIQAEACAPWAGKQPAGYTIADGIAVNQPGAMTHAILDSRLAEVRTVSDEPRPSCCSSRGQKYWWKVPARSGSQRCLTGARRCKAQPVSFSQAATSTRAYCCRLCAGLTRAGRYLMLRIRVPDRPGQLSRVLAVVAEHGGNLVTVFHQREEREGLGILETEIDLTILARDERHADEILAALAELDVRMQRLN